jgi:hypothetical protein
MNESRAKVLQILAAKDAESMRRQISELKSRLLDLEKGTAFRGGGSADPAWPLLARAITSDHPTAERYRDMLEGFARHLDDLGTLTERQREALASIVYDLDGTAEERALAFPCPECGAAVDTPCVGVRKPTIKIPHDGRLALLPQEEPVRRLRASRSVSGAR